MCNSYSLCCCFFTMLWTGYMFEEIVIQSETIRLSRCCYLSLLIGILIWSSIATTIFLLFSGGRLQDYLQIQQNLARKRAILRRTFLHLWLVQPCRIIKHLTFSWRNIFTWRVPSIHHDHLMDKGSVVYITNFYLLSLKWATWSLCIVNRPELTLYWLEPNLNFVS